MVILVLQKIYLQVWSSFYNRTRNPRILKTRGSRLDNIKSIIHFIRKCEKLERNSEITSILLISYSNSKEYSKIWKWIQ